jgi:hypothetical protein
MSVQRKDEQWLLFNESNSGMKARVYDVVIPEDLSEDKLAQYLDDIYHEHSSERHPQVEQLI